MSLLVVGSVALDTVQTPYGEATEVLGGSAVYFSFAASFFTPVRLMSVVGEDFPHEHVELLVSRKIDASGLLPVPGRTFRWSGRYAGAMNAAETLSVELNVFGHFDPKVPEPFVDSRYVFLANGPPAVQMRVLSQMRSPELVVADTMNYYIREEPRAVAKVMGMVDGAVMNDAEARMMTGLENLPLAGRKLLELGPKFVVIKKGEHGALLVTHDGFFVLPAYPTTNVVDPTGAGDSFAGGMMGYLARQGDASVAELKRALAYGTVIASLNVEGFSLDRMKTATPADVEERYRHLRRMIEF